MENYVFDPNTKLPAVYCNGRKPPHLFRIPTDVTVFGLKSQLNQINIELNYRDTQRVDGVEYWRPLINSAESVRFSWMKLMSDDDVRTMFSIFGQFSTRGPIELDASLVRSMEHIQQSLIRPRNYEEIRALTNAPDEDINLDDLWWCVMFYLIMCFEFYLRVNICLPPVILVISGLSHVKIFVYIPTL